MELSSSDTRVWVFCSSVNPLPHFQTPIFSAVLGANLCASLSACRESLGIFYAKVFNYNQGKLKQHLELRILPLISSQDEKKSEKSHLRLFMHQRTARHFLFNKSMDQKLAFWLLKVWQSLQAGISLFF